MLSNKLVPLCGEATVIILELIFDDVETDIVFEIDAGTLVLRDGLTTSCVIVWDWGSSDPDCDEGSSLTGLMGFSAMGFIFGLAGDFLVGFFDLFTPKISLYSIVL